MIESLINLVLTIGTQNPLLLMGLIAIICISAVSICGIVFAWRAVCSFANKKE